MNLGLELFFAAAAPAAAEVPAATGGLNLIHGFLLGALAVAVVLFTFDSRRPRLAKRYLRFLLLGCMAVLILAPLVWIYCSIFKKNEVLMAYPFLPPLSKWGETLGLDNFRRLFTPRVSLQGPIVFWQYMLNSLFLASAATMIQMFFCSLGGYALAKFRFNGRRQLMLFMLGSMTLPGMLFLAPLFELMFRLGWLDTYAALLVPGAATAFGIFLFRQAMQAVPDSLIEAARVDGAGEFFIYWRIIMPLVQPMTAAFCLIVFMGQWNSFISPQIYLQSTYKLTVPVVLSQYMTQYAEDYGMFLAGTALAIVPIAILFLALQREFIAGLTSGAVKG